MTDTPQPRPEPKPGILDIAQYRPGKSKADGFADPIKLSSNENILGSSPRARAAHEAASGQLHLYPDGQANTLRAAIGARYGLEPERLILGCGTDEIFQLINQAYLSPGDNMVQGQYGFGAYAIGARACMGEVRYAPEKDFRIDVDALLEQVDDRTRIVFIANPANPTGTFITGQEVRRLHSALPGNVLLVLDGAYGEFVTDPAFDDGRELARTAANVIVTHTFSKLHGLAGLRVGWGYAPAPVAAAIDRIRLPFNTSIPAQNAAIAALADEDFQKASVDHVAHWLPWLSEQIAALGFDVVPSAANFLLIGFQATPGRTAAEAEAFLAGKGLIVRGVAGYGLPDHLRITVGLEAHNHAVIAALAEFMATKIV